MSIAYGSAYWPYGTGALSYIGVQVRLRQAIVTAILARLATILVANEYQTAIGSNVYEWKTTKWETGQVPGVTVKDVKDDILSEQTRSTQNFLLHVLTVQIELATSGSTSMTEIRKMIGDVYHSIWIDETWGGLAFQTNDLGNEVATEKDELQVVGATILIQVAYRTSKFLEA